MDTNSLRYFQYSDVVRLLSHRSISQIPLKLEKKADQQSQGTQSDGHLNPRTMHHRRADVEYRIRKSDDNLMNDPSREI